MSCGATLEVDVRESTAALCCIGCVSIIAVKCYCSQHRPGVNRGTWWNENYLKHRIKQSWVLTLPWKPRLAILSAVKESAMQWNQETCKGLRSCIRYFAAAVCHLRMFKIRLLPQPRGASVWWQQRNEVVLRSSRRTSLLPSKSVVDRLIPTNQRALWKSTFMWWGLALYLFPVSLWFCSFSGYSHEFVYKQSGQLLLICIQISYSLL